MPGTPAYHATVKVTSIHLGNSKVLCTCFSALLYIGVQFILLAVEKSIKYEGTKMKYKKFIATLTFPLLLLGAQISSAATLSLDLDIHAPGIQSNRSLNPGDSFEIGVIFTGDGSSQFDTFAFDLIHDSDAISLRNPVAGSIVDSAPMMALDLYGADPLSSGDQLTQGSMPIPLGFENGLGGVGVSSVGGLPFSLLAQDERIGLFSASLFAQHNGTSILTLSGYPFGVGAELSLAGTNVPVTLEGATVTVVPIPAAIWLFASGVMGFLGVGYRKGAARHVV
jgi:hypothetical protein